MGPQDQEPQQPVPQPAPQPPQQFQQFQPQPIQQTQPMASEPMMSAPLPTPTAKKTLSKGALWGIIGGAAGLLIVLIGLVLALTVFGGPSKTDYSKAADKISEANAAYNDISLDAYELTSSSSTDISRKNAQEGMQKSADKFNAAFEEAGKMKGVSGDKEVKAKYDAVEAKRAAFNAAVEKLMEISSKFTSVYSDFAKIASSSTANQTAATRKSLENVGTLKDAATNTFITASITYLRALEDYQAYRTAYTAGGVYDPNAYTKYSAAYDTYVDAAKDWQSSIEKMSDDAELKDELNELGDALNTKMFDK